jgi:hypothetical protein
MPAGNLFMAAATLKDEATRLPAAKLAALNKGAIAACDACLRSGHRHGASPGRQVAALFTNDRGKRPPGRWEGVERSHQADAI